MNADRFKPLVRPRQFSFPRVWTVAVVGLLVLGVTACSSTNEVTVVRVVGGNSVIVDRSGSEQEVRLPSIDSPPLVDPSGNPECLGRDARDYADEILAPGAQVSLEFDKESKDSSGRSLAEIRLRDGDLASVLIAKQGLGVPIDRGQSSEIEDEVEAAFVEASGYDRGFFSEENGCTIVSKMADLEQAQTELEAQDTGSSVAEAVAVAAATAALLKTHSALREALHDTEHATALSIRALVRAGRGVEFRRVSERFAAIDRQQDELDQLVIKRKKKVAAKKLAAKKARAEAAAASARDEAASKRPARTYRPTVPTKMPAPSGGGNAGYTGPRCYAPGGKTWRPC